ncbi:MAG: ABC transporter ATP-binding protein [Planctomycetota bacterium]|jgi:lipoprotein-releasing system ATP-binding protein
MDIILRAENLVKDYRIGRSPLRVLRGVTMQVRRGELLSIVGPSGAGKSTLLHLLGMLDTPTEGRVLHGKTDLAALSAAERARWRNRLFGFVFQFYHLLPDFTALENVAMPALVGAGIGGWRQAKSEARGKALRVLELVDLPDRANHRPSQLSGGERQRVAIGRALINRPEVLLCDEPTGNLDSDTGQHILDLLEEIREQTGCTVVIVTHDERVATLGERTIHLVDGQIAR